MSDIIVQLRAPGWDKHPLIAGALVAVERAQTPRRIRASAQVACRVHLPSHMISLDGQKFFTTSSSEAEDRVYLKATHYLETLMREEPFLS